MHDPEVTVSACQVPLAAEQALQQFPDTYPNTVHLERNISLVVVIIICKHGFAPARSDTFLRCSNIVTFTQLLGRFADPHGTAAAVSCAVSNFDMTRQVQVIGAMQAEPVKDVFAVAGATCNYVIFTVTVVGPTACDGKSRCSCTGLAAGTTSSGSTLGGFVQGL